MIYAEFQNYYGCWCSQVFGEFRFSVDEFIGHACSWFYNNIG